MAKRTPPFSPEVRERAVRMVQEHKGEHGEPIGDTPPAEAEAAYYAELEATPMAA